MTYDLLPFLFYSLFPIPYSLSAKENPMKRHALPILLLCASVICGFCLAGYGEAKKEAPRPTERFRREYIKKFPRTGMSTTEGDATMLRILVEARNAQRGIEVGSEQGYGAINMGLGFERTGGKLLTLEIVPALVKECRQNIQTMGLTETVTCIEGDALKTLPTLEGTFDFMFIDAVKKDYLKYFKAVEAKLKPGAVIVADNVIRSGKATADFLDYMKDSLDYEIVVIRASEEKNDGMAICYKLR